MGQNLPRLWLPLPLIGLGEHKFEAIPQKIGEFQGLDKQLHLAHSLPEEVHSF